MTADRRIQVRIVDPNGTEHDVTDRVDWDSLGAMTEETEEDLLQLSHSDIDLELFDDDGWASDLFAAVERGQVWEVIVERELAAGGWERVFGGTIDVPASIEIDRENEVVSLQVFAYSKLLELYSAESLQRSFADRTGTTSAGAKTCTMNDTTGLVAGDTIRLETAGGSSEERTVATVDSGVQITATENWTNAFSSAPATLVTPFPRNQSVTDLATDLFALAGITDVQVDIAQELASEPFPSPIGTSGLPGTTPAGVLETGGEVKVYTGGKRYGATDLDSGFADQGTDTAKLDWRPYDATSTAPATLRAGTDDGSIVFDPATGHSYQLVTTSGSLKLQKDTGAGFADLVTVHATTDDGCTYRKVGLDWCPQLSEVWVGFAVDNYTTNPSPPPARFFTTREIGLNRYSSAGVLQGALPGGLPRSCRVRGEMAVRELDTTFADIGLTLYDVSGASPAFVRTLPPTDGLVVWTLRALDADYVCAVAQPSTGGTVIAVWDDAAGELLAEHSVSGATTSVNVATVFNEGGTSTPAYVAYGGGVWVAVSVSAAGVISYADFENLSAAAALRELAIATGSHFWVDEYKVGWLVGRQAATLTSRDPVEIGEPFSPRELPVWEWLRTGVIVTCKSEAGDDVEGKAGNTADSARRLDVDTSLPLLAGWATALANAYLSYLSVRRRQLDETIEEPEARRVRLLDVVTREGATYQALRVETDFRRGTQKLQLVELEG